MTLTHFKNNEFADSATDDPKYHGINDFGRDGHPRDEPPRHAGRPQPRQRTTRCATRSQVSKAPVIFSHASARALADHPRNVPDDILQARCRRTAAW